MKFCINCKNSKYEPEGVVCKALPVRTDLIYGEVVYTPADVARRAESPFLNAGACGPEGKLFEPLEKAEPISFWKCLWSDRTRRTDRTGPGSR